MTLESSLSKAVFNGNDAAVNFPFNFRVWNASQLDVSVMNPDGVTAPATGWSVALTGSGGTVTYRREGAPLPTGWKLVILRNMPFVQGVDLVTGTRFDPEVVELQLDHATAERQQLLEKVNRAIVVPPGNPDPPELLAEKIFQARDQAVASAGAAGISAGNAAASAREAEAALGATLRAKDDALSAIGTAGEGAVSRVRAEGENAVRRVRTEGEGAVQQVRVEGEGAVQRVRSEKVGALAAVIIEGDRQVARVAGEADTWLTHMGDEADRASREADRAEQAASAIPGLAANLSAFQGYRVEGAYLMRYTPDSSTETTSITDYDAYDVLPVGSGWRIIDGHLMLETAFSA